jgi:hypothetical protein
MSKKLLEPGIDPCPYSAEEMARIQREVAVIKAAEKRCPECRYLGGYHWFNCSVPGPRWEQKPCSCWPNEICGKCDFGV